MAEYKRWQWLVVAEEKKRQELLKMKKNVIVKNCQRFVSIVRQLDTFEIKKFKIHPSVISYSKTNNWPVRVGSKEKRVQ